MSDLTKTIERMYNTLVQTKFESELLWCVKELKNQLTEANTTIDGLREELGQMQVQIDSLMLEYCPDEMTIEQKDNWAKHQKPVREV